MAWGYLKVDEGQEQPRLAQEAERVKRQIRREGLVGLMNTPKWRRLITALAPFALRFRCKWVDVDEPSRWMPALTVVADQYLDSIHYGPVGSFEIEWLEVAPARDGFARRSISIGELADLVASLRVPHEVEGETVRVIGYRRPLPPLERGGVRSGR